MKKRAVLIDDESKSRIALRSFLDKYCPSVEVVGEADGVETGMACIQKEAPDVAFLDIEMKDGTGFDLIEQNTGPQPEIVFVTAYNQYAIQAFRCSAIDYLLKPVNPEELVKAVHKLTDKNKISEIEKKLEALSHNRTNLEKIAIPSTDGLRLESISDIQYCEADNYYTTIHLINGEKVIVSKTLKEYEKMLEQQGFFRIHQKFLVNLSEIKSYSKADGGYVSLKNGIGLTVSRRKKEELIHLLMK